MEFSAFADCQIGGFGKSDYSRIVLTGDLHSVVRGLLGFPETKQGRDDAKKYTFSIQYGAALEGVISYLILENYGFTRATAAPVAEALLNGYVGRVSGRGSRKTFSGGFASEGYQYLQNWSYRAVPRTCLANRAVPIPLRPQYTTTKHERSMRNYPAQGGGADILHFTYAKVRQLADQEGITMIPCISIHDRLAWLVPDEDIDRAELVLEAAHLWVVAKFYASLNLEAYPTTYQFFGDIDVDDRLRLIPTSTYATPSTPAGFPLTARNQAQVVLNSIKKFEKGGLTFKSAALTIGLWKAPD